MMFMNLISIQIAIIQYVFSIVIIGIIVFILVKSSNKNRNLSLHVYDEFLEKCNLMTSQGEIIYFSIEDIECIVDRLKFNIESKEQRISNTKAIYMILAVLFAGFLGLVIVVFLYKDKLRNSYIVERNVRLDELIDKCRYLSEVGTVNFWSVNELEQIVNELKYK